MKNHERLTPSRRTALLAVGLLLGATLAIGAATHGRGPDPNGGSAARRTSSNGAVSVSARLDRTAVLAGGEGLVRMEIALDAVRQDSAAPHERSADLVVVLDRSGSMNGQKIRDAKNAIRQLIARLGPEDRFALVAFSSRSETLIPLTSAGDASSERWRSVVAGIHAGGGTFMAPGLATGLGHLEAGRTPGRSSRAIVISDGLAAEPPELLRSWAARAVPGEYSVSTVGVGDDFDEQLMSSLADAGTGNYYFLENADALAEVFAAEFETARETVASAVTVTIEPGPGVRVADAAGYPLEREAGIVRFRPGTLYAGQKRRVWVSLRVPTTAGSEALIRSLRVDYTDRGEKQRLSVDDLPPIACVEDEDRFFAKLDAGAWAESVAVEEYNQLRQSVAGLVKAGRKTRALGHIADFKRRNTAINEVMASPAVASQLRAADALEDEVAESFRGPDAERKQIRLGKTLHAQGTLERRKGSRK